MKKYTIATVFALFAFMLVSNVALAGGGFEPQNLNPDGTLKTTINTNSAVAPVPVSYDDAINSDQTASAGSALSTIGSPTGIAVVLLILLIAVGFMYATYRNSTPKGY